MTTTEQLQRIRAKCVELTYIYDNAEPHTPIPAVAGWRSTIAAIDLLLGMKLTEGQLEHILKAWEGLV